MTRTRHWHVSLMVEILACVRVDGNCPEDVIHEIASSSISLFPAGQEDVSLEVENVEMINMVEIGETGE